MKHLYLASPYYDSSRVTGANKRFDRIGERAVSTLGDRCKVIVCEGQIPPWINPENAIALPAFSNSLGRIRAFLAFGRVLLRLEPGIVINDFIPIPFFGLRRHTHFQLIHELRHFTKYQRNRMPLVTPLIMQRQLRRSQHIIAVSEFAKNDVVAKCGVPAEKIIRSYNGIVGFGLDEANQTERKNDLLYVATFEARKNHETLMKALAAIERPLKVTFVGRDHGLLSHTLDLADSLEKKHGTKFTFIESTDEESLAELYRTTKTYVCPSVLEGFGMPLLEALASNCNVVCSDIPVFHEVCGNDALYVDPRDATALAKALQESLELPSPDYGQAYTRKFCWDAITDQLLRNIGCLPP